MSDFYSPVGSLYSPSSYGKDKGFYDLPSRAPQSLEQKIFEAEGLAKSHGIKIPDRKQKIRLWDLLEWARYPITNMIYTGVKEAKEERLTFDDIGKILKSAWYGITLKEKRNTEDVLKILYPEAPKWVLTVAGLAGDIITDPATWVSFGMAGGIKGAARAGAKGAKYSQKLVKRIAQEGAKGAFAKQVIAKYGGKTWQEAVQLAARTYAREAGEYGLRLGIPFTKVSTPLVAGGPLDWAQKGFQAIGAENLAKAMQRAPAAIRQLPGIAGITRAFSTSAKWKHFPEAHDIERVASRAASFRTEMSLDNFRTITRSVKELIDNPTPAVSRVIDTLGKPKGWAPQDAVLEYIWRHNELLATGKGVYGTPAAAVHAKIPAHEILKKTIPLQGLPEELTMLDDQLRIMLDDIWGEFVSRDMTKKVKYLEAYYPRFAKDAKGNMAVIMRRELSSDVTFLHTRRFATRGQAEKAGFKLLAPSESLVQYAQRASTSLMNHDLVKEMVDTYGVVAKKAPAGFKRVKVDGFKEYVLPPDIAEVINKTTQVLLEPDETAKAVEYFTKVQNVWKKHATIYNPGFHARNFLSNVWTGAYKDGIGPRQLNNFMKSVQIHAWSKHPDKLIEITLDGKKVGKTAKELYEMMRTAGAHVGRFEAAELITPAFGKAVGAVEQAGSAVGSLVENTARVASVLSDMDKGLTLAQATKRMNHFFLDYGDLTKVEEKIRKVIPFYCVPTDCEILTRDGWKRYTELAPNQTEVLAYDVERDTAFWHPLRGVAVFDYDGQLLTIESRLEKWSFTPDHGWPVFAHEDYKNGLRQKIVKGYRLRAGHRIPRVAAHTEWPTKCDLTEREGEILGWLLTDGNIRQRTKNFWQYVIYQKKSQFITEIRELLGGECSEYVHPDTGVIRFELNGNLRKRMQKIITDKTTAFPLIMSLTEPVARVVWDAMYKADGTISKQRSDRDGLTDLYFAAKAETKNGLAVGDVFQALTLLLNRAVNKSVNGRGMYIARAERFKRINESLGTEWYKGKIWCPEIDGLCWYMRRNGKVILTKNTWLKKNLAVQVGEFIHNPGKYSMMTIKPLRAMDWLAPEEKEYLPDWMAQDLYVNPFGAQGAYGSPLMFNPNFPFQDIGKLATPGKAIMEGISPFAKTPFELGLNVSAFTGQPLQYTDYDYRPAPPAIRIVVDRFPPEIKQRLGIKSDEFGNMIMPGKWVHALTAFIPLIKTGGTIERLIQTMTGAGMPEYRAERAPWDVLSRTAGVKFRPYDVEYYKEKALQERLRQLKGLTNLTGAKIP